MIELLICTALALSGTLPAFALELHSFDIPEEPASEAIRDFGAQAHVQILVAGENVKDKSLRAVHGILSTDDALNTLLSGSALGHQYVAEGSIALVSLASQDSSAPQDASGGKGSGTRVKLAQAGPTETPNRGGARAGDQLEEVVVTAQKKEQFLQDVPVPVSVVTAESLIDNGPLRIQDYYNQIPGLNMTPALNDQNTLSIRGITTGQGGNRTVGIMVDDVPYGPEINNAGGAAVPDFDPEDLSRVEVLRGPQGTLYGASSMGGLLKFVTVDPSTDRLSGRVQVGTDTIYNGTGLGYSARGSINVPLSDTLAVRASGFTRTEPGYIDDITTDRSGVNNQRASGGRLAALWHPTDTLSLKLSALYQDFRSDGTNEVQPALGDLKQDYVAGSGGFHKKVQIYNATLTAQLAGVDVVWITGYNENSDHVFNDGTEFYGPYTQQQFGVTGSPYLTVWSTNKFVQELRLSSWIGSKLEWRLGAFYTNERSDIYQDQWAATPSGQIVGTWYHLPFPSTYKEYAGFVDMTYHFTDHFDLQVGGRESRNDQTLKEAIIGPYDPTFLLVPSPVIFPEERTQDHSFTYLVTPRYKITDDLMAYVRVASGYRPGGPNLNGVPIPAKPDTTVNYELGFKGDFVDHRLSVDASVYYIDWSNIQISLVDPSTQLYYLANGSGAKSQGVELSLTSKPLHGLTVGGWVAYNDAVLTRAFPPSATIPEPRGARLPEAARLTGNFSVDDAFTIAGDLKGTVGGTFIWVGDRYGLFHLPRDYYPGYGQVNLRAGVNYQTWKLNLYGYNVADRRGVLSAGQEASNPDAVIYLQPRTIGLSVSKAF